ncbi:AraC family transcriptional regulator [Hwanghaeella grinnelliae]|uniref:AraC family transcriptional regulator n=1 Tax=Hwanghaeella grinnelliae TaxID=2500179 RepID=A0A437QTY5_9PROT|nr:AraC family transcriptional regulator [Hwanghaeella grinnelliae]RVU37977.1 AraC family transcriptional regulator [Hwanghaeella grinnelliae]
MRRILKAIDRIETHLGEDLRLDEVASAAGVSRYHFCRTFQAMTGWTVMGYVRARRLSRAAELLRDDSMPIVQVALECGFGSQQAFTRSFSDFFGVSPGTVRNGRWSGTGRLVSPLSGASLTFLKEQEMMEPRILEKGRFAAIGLKGSFQRDNTSEIPTLWETVEGRWAQLLPLMTEGGIGACFGDNGRTDRFDYIAGVMAKVDAIPPDGMDKVVIEPQTYAVFTHKLTGQTINIDIKPTLQHIFGTWLPNSGYRLAQSADFEYFGERFDPVNKAGEIDFYVPVTQ